MLLLTCIEGSLEPVAANIEEGKRKRKDNNLLLSVQGERYTGSNRRQDSACASLRLEHTTVESISWSRVLALAFNSNVGSIDRNFVSSPFH